MVKFLNLLAMLEVLNTKKNINDYSKCIKLKDMEVHIKKN